MTAIILAIVLAAASPTPSAAQAHIAQVRAAIDTGNAAYISTWQHADAAGFAAHRRRRRIEAPLAGFEKTQRPADDSDFRRYL